MALNWRRVKMGERAILLLVFVGVPLAIGSPDPDTVVPMCVGAALAIALGWPRFCKQ